jgi:DNA-binding NtrC family response regulator
MPHRNKILILETDDFLREIIGNLLHKRGGYILNGSCVSNGLEQVNNGHVGTVILSTSCPEYKGQETLKFIKNKLNQINPPEFFIINHTGKHIGFINDSQQMSVDDLSIGKILEVITI